MDLPLPDPPRPGSVHRFMVRFPEMRPQIIDYLDESSIHLHLSLRPASGVVALNDMTGGQWNRQLSLTLPELGRTVLPLELHFGFDHVELRCAGQSLLLTGRQGNPGEAAMLRFTQGVSLLDGVPPLAAPAAPPVQPAGRFVGGIDRCNDTLVRGWAADLDRPGQPVAVEVLRGTESLGWALADRGRRDLARLRDDLATAGFLFRFAAPLRWEEGEELAIAVRILGHEVELAHSPWPVARATPHPAPPLVAR
ncbi:hypothetical protein [Pseudoroseomonas cervicalis]|uniref:hypothetical protein n=1 Tax=Teichococcus cervicalis TaxID=204525 RepID=UPI0022F19DA2|nr:hypothetical protein [Pseudoroseomonas cervicalis]WBV44543.1 hypothetical protein PFY06_08305 [Pseudoroseomonas cervicalis]